ncbi:MAG: glycosyltransferase family 2 protein [Halioglobus sp.]
MNSVPNLEPGQAVELSVSVVLHHSDVQQLACCLLSLRDSALEAINRGLLAYATVSLVDNSCEERYRVAVDGVIDSLGDDPGLSFELLSLAENRGFGHAHNRVMDSVSTDLHLVLNPDTELETETLSAGITAIIEENAVLVSPRVIGAQGHQEFLCKRYPSVLLLFLRGFAPRALRRWFDPQLSRYEMRDVCSGDNRADITIASGCFMLVRVSALRDVGVFDDRYFLYFEDFDLSTRLKNSGRLVYAPAMRIKHYGGYAARKGFRHVRYFVRSAVRFFHQHGWRWV